MNPVVFATIGTISLCAVVIVILLLAAIGLLSTIASQLRIIAGAMSMIATTFDERDPHDPEQRLFFKSMNGAIYHGVVDAMFNVKQNS